MCGRYASARSVDDLVVAFGADGVEGEPPAPSWNVAPTDAVPVVLDRSVTQGGGRRRVVRVARWGLVPAWSADTRGAARMINARVEGVAAAPAFRTALSRRRCVIPADGWYEWHQPADPTAGGGGGDDEARGAAGRGRRVPFYLRRADGRLLWFAGLFERWTPPGSASRAPDGTLWTVTVITGGSVGPCAWLHDRMPMVVREGCLDGWLDRGRTDVVAALASVAAAGTLDLVAHRVGDEVGDVRAEGAHLVEPVGADGRRDDDDRSDDDRSGGGRSGGGPLVLF